MRVQTLRGVMLLCGFMAWLTVQALAVTPYVAPDAIKVEDLLPAPPALNSAEGRAELENVVFIHQHATVAELRRGQEENELSIFTYAPEIGDWFIAGRLPKTVAFFKEIEAETRAFTSTGKTLWKRPRPCVTGGTRIAKPIEPDDKKSFSYPSGHSTRATVFTFVLAELIPGSKEALLKAGRESGYLRVVGGMHYPSDIQAGRVLALAILKELKKSPRFLKDLAEVQEEIQNAQG